MAKTQTYGDIITTISRKISRVTEEDFAALMLNLAIAEIWKRYDWRESLVELPGFWLSPKTQDYGSPLGAVPVDFEGLRTAQILQFTSAPARIIPIDVTKFLDKTNIEGCPSSISYNADTSSFRLWPNVPGSWGVPEYMVTGTYKKLPPRVLSSTYQGTTLPFDDKYYYVIVETALWKGYELNGSPMEEKAILKSLSAIDEMARDQGLNDGDGSITPSSSLAFTSNTSGGNVFWG